MSSGMSRNKNEDDEYWNSTKYKGFMFENDDDEFVELKESKRAVNSLHSIVSDDDDDVEKVSWSGEPVGSISWSIKENATEGRSGDLRELSASRSSSDTMHQTTSKPASSYSLSSFFKGKRDSSSGLFGISRPGSFQTLSDSVTGIPSGYAPDLRKSKADYKDFSTDWSPEQTVRQMQKGRMYSLERFRSLKDKLLLVDEAVQTHDGNVITAILIFLKKTLSKEVLFRELQCKQLALQQFVHYLKETGEQKLLMELLRALGRTEEAALLHYKEHLNIKDHNKKKEYLKSCVGLPFAIDDGTFVEDHYTLLERQIIIDENDKRVEASKQMKVFNEHPRKASILCMPLVTTLYYSCFYHYGESDGTFSSPANLKKTFKISDKQYLLTALAARAKLKAWKDVDSLFITKNWLGYTKKKAPIGFHRVVDILDKNNAPVEVTQEYIALVDNTELKLNLATKLKCHNIVIDTYRDLRDRQQLIQYKNKIDRNSQEQLKIDCILSNSQIRWKN